MDSAARYSSNGDDPEDLLELTVHFDEDSSHHREAPEIPVNQNHGSASESANQQVQEPSTPEVTPDPSRNGLGEWNAAERTSLNSPPALAAEAAVATPASYSPLTGGTDSAVLPGQEEEVENWGLQFLKELVETLVLALIIFLLIRTVVQNYRIEGHSMEPNFHDGEYLLVNKLAYKLGEYSRGDVVVFHYPNDPSRDFIKRIIGLPGDTVEIHNGTIFVNDQPLEEPYTVVPINYERAPILVDADQLYVLGDNRPYSSDSHQWGLLPTDLVIGKAWVGIWPPSVMGVVPHEPPVLGPKVAQGP